MERGPLSCACYGTFYKGMEGKGSPKCVTEWHNKAVPNGSILFTCGDKMVPNFTKPAYAEI